MSKVGITLAVAIAVLMGGGLTYAVDVIEKSDDSEKLAVNAKCPMSGRDINPDATSTYQGEVVAFCCNDCKGNFDDAPAEHIDKVERLTVNTACPVSGREIDPTKTVVYEGQTIGFCCGNCQGKFEEEPSEHISEVEYEPMNKSCPVSGRSVDTDQVSVYQSRVVAFCCGNCKGNFDEDPEEHIAELEIDNR